MPADLPTLQRSRMPRQRLSSTGVTEYWIGTAVSVRLDVGRPDHLGPLFGVICDELAEIGGRADKRRASKVGKPRLPLWIGAAAGGLLFLLFVGLRPRVVCDSDCLP